MKERPELDKLLEKIDKLLDGDFGIADVPSIRKQYYDEKMRRK